MLLAPAEGRSRDTTACAPYLHNLPLTRLPDDRGRLSMWGMPYLPRWRAIVSNGR